MDNELLDGPEIAELVFDRDHKIPCRTITTAKFCISDMAQWLAGAEDKEQATFFNEFDVQLRRLCSLKEGSMGHSMQIHMASKYLTVDAKYTLADFGDST